MMLFRRTRREEQAATDTAPETASEPAPEGDPQLAAIASLSGALVRAKDPEAAARTLIETCLSLLGVEFAGVAAIDEDGRHAEGLLAMTSNGDVDWWRDVRIDFDDEPSGIASAVFEAAPVVVYDVSSSTQVSPRLAERVGAKSAVFVPLVAEQKVPAVLVLATTEAPRVFTSDELSLLQALAAEAALGLDRARSADELADALERERLVASIGRKVRSELDLDDVLRVAVETAGVAVGVSRCFLRIGETTTAMPIAAEWTADGFAPVGELAGQLAGSNLAARERRTVAVGDVREAPELKDPELGGVQALLDLDTLATLGTPVLVFDRMIGVLGFHRAEPGV